MNILLIHNRYGKFSGEEAVVQLQHTLFEQNGHTVIPYQRGSDELLGSRWGKHKAFFTAIYNPKSIRDLKQIIALHHPDVAIVHNLFPLISPAILPLLKQQGIPTAMVVHNYRLLCPNGLFFNKGSVCEKCIGKGKEWNCIANNCEQSYCKSIGYAIRNYWSRANKLYLNNIDKYLTLSQFQKGKLMTCGINANKISVVPNGSDFAPYDKPYELGDYVAFSGRMSKEKGIDVLLRAAKLLPSIKFKIAGAQREQENIQIPPNVEIVGFLEKDSLSVFYRHARMLVMTSNCYEGQGLVMIEAMLQKKPVIAPGHAGFAEVVSENQTGLLFKSGNAEHLAEQINTLWNDESRCKEFGEAGYNRANAKYSKNRYYKNLMEQLESIV